jgi:hypothetical protein
MKKRFLLFVIAAFTIGITLSGCYCGYHTYHHHGYYR